MPRKPKLNQVFIERAADLLRTGCFQKNVCELLGVAEQTWYRWLREGQAAEKGIKRDFYEAVNAANAEAEINLVAELQRVAHEEKEWRAVAWMLERKFPERWARKDRTKAEAEKGVITELKVKVEYGD